MLEILRQCMKMILKGRKSRCVFILFLIHYSVVGQTVTYKELLSLYKRHQYDKLVEHCDRFIQENTNDTLEANTYVLKGIVYYRNQNYNLSIENSRKALYLRIKIYGESHSRVGEVYNNMGVVYREKKEYQKALDCYQKDIETQTTPTQLASTCNNIANVYAKLAQPDSAIYYYRKSLMYYPEEKKHLAHHNIGNFYQEQKKYGLALQYLTKALEEKKKHLSPSHYSLAQTYNNIALNFRQIKLDEEAIKYVNQALDILHSSPKVLLESFLLKSLCTRDLAQYTEALQTLYRADSLIEETRKQLDYKSDKLYFGEKASQVNELGIDLNLTLKNYGQAFYFAERNKANVLLNLMRKADVQSESLRSEILSIPEIQEKIAPRQALLNYVYFEERLVVFVITKQDFQIVFLSSFPKEDTLKQFPALISDVFQRKAYLTTAFSLYQVLFQPLEKYLKGIDDIILIPDGNLSKVPFEAFVYSLSSEFANSRTIDFKKLNYLIKKYNFSYHLSATLALRDKSVKKHQYEYTGFAPILSLKYSMQAVEQAQKIFPNSKVFQGNAAGKEEVQQQRINSRILHFATHSKKDSLGYATILMRNEQIYWNDIFELDCEVDLVVLASCKSGRGEVKAGEGLLNFGYAFIYAGVDSIVYSLFPVFDKYTGLLTKRFYQNIKLGQSYKEALQQAKLTMVQEIGHPNSWAGVIILR